MTKQSFPIPEGCKAVTVEQVGNQIITTFEPSQPKFKRGDVLISKDEKYCWIVVFKGFDQLPSLNKMCFYVMLSGAQRIVLNDNCNPEGFRHATPEEAQQLWDALAKDGKRWNLETMQVEPTKKKRWRAESGEEYYFISPSLRTGAGYEVEHDVDNIRYEKGNYFQTIEQAQRAANRLRAELDKFWEEELK